MKAIKLTIILTLILCIKGFAQENETVTVEEAQEKSRGFIKELFEFRIFNDALKVRQTYDVHKNNTHNPDLQSRIIDFRSTNINFYVKGEIDYDHFWVWVSNNPSERTPDGEISDLISAGYKVLFKPTWDVTIAPPKESEDRKYKVSVEPDFTGLTGDFSLETLGNRVNQPYQDEMIISLTERPVSQFNAGLFNGLDYLEGRLNVNSTDILEIKNYTQRFLPASEEEPFNLTYELKETELADIEKVRMEVYKKTEDGEDILYRTDDITDLSDKSFSWNGMIENSGEGEDVSYVTYNDNPLFARVVASEKEGGKTFKAENEFKVKGNLVDIDCSPFFETENDSRSLEIEYTVENDNSEDVKLVAGKIVIKDKNGDEIDELVLEKSGDILKGDVISWDPKEFKEKINYENSPLSFELIAATDPEFNDKYSDETTSYLNPLKISTKTPEGEFTPGIEDYEHNKLEIEYEVRDIAALSNFDTKIQIYDNIDQSIVNTLTGFDKTKKEITWDGKKDDGEYVIDDDCKFEIQLKTGKDYSIFKATQDYVNINAEGWRNFRYAEISPWDSFSEFNAIADDYMETLEESEVPEEFSDNPIEYLEKHLVENVEFLGKPITGKTNIYFVYVLKLVEKNIKDKNSSTLNNYISENYTGFNFGERVSSLGSHVSNHSLGFALDINATKNPQLVEANNSHYLYHLIYLVTGHNLYKTSSTIDEMKTVHNEFMNNLKKISSADLKSEVISRLDKLNSLASYELEFQEGKKLFSFNDIRNNEISNYLQSIIYEIPTYTGDNEEEVINKLSAQLLQLVFLSGEIYYVKELMDDLFKAYYFDVRYLNDYNQVREYFEYVESKIKEMGVELNSYKSNLNDNVPRFTIKNNSMESFNKIFEEVIESNDIIKTKFSEKLSEMPGKIKSALNNSSDVHGGKILEIGFFELNVELVKCFNDNEYITWGGFYPSSHDWMHFEVRPLDNKQYSWEKSKGQDNLHYDFTLDEIINKINDFGFEQYKWNDSDKKDYIVKK